MIKKILILIPIVGIILSILVMADSQQGINETNIVEQNFTNEITINEIKTNEEIYDEIEEKYSQIESSDSLYIPKERNWQGSGPFKIDRGEYILGEKIFFIADGIDYNEKGQIVFLRPLNSTHYAIWKTFDFNGLEKTAFNIYFEPRIQKEIGICSKMDLIGDWKIYFRGVKYEPIPFKISEEILPTEEDKFNRTEC